MTTVAVKDNIIAADTQGRFEGCIMTMHKIFRVRDELIGICGDFDAAIEFVKLYREDKHPIKPDDTETDFDYLLLNSKGIYLTTGYGIPMKIIEKFWAIGSGKEAAITAMRMGATAKEAVKMASLVDCYTGSKVMEKKL